MFETYAVSINVDLAKARGAYRPLWNWVGYDEPNYTDTANGRKLLQELADLSPAPVRVRTHNLLTSGDGRYALKWGSTNVYTEDDAGAARLDDHGPHLRRLYRGGKHPVRPGGFYAGGALRRSGALSPQLVA